MALDISLDTIGYTWKLRYITEEKTDIRDYMLIPTDSANNHFIIDEKNTILLDTYWLDDGLYSMFDVGESRLITSNTLLNDSTMLAEILIFETKVYRKSGEAEDMPEVLSYRLKSKQKTVLVKQNP